MTVRNIFVLLHFSCITNCASKYRLIEASRQNISRAARLDLLSEGQGYPKLSIQNNNRRRCHLQLWRDRNFWLPGYKAYTRGFKYHENELCEIA